MQNVFVVKKSGEREEFSESKVLRSMQRVGVPFDLQPQALRHIEERLRDNVSTDEIFSHILEFLKQKDKKSSLRFNLRQAVFDLGPTGFPFEKYLSRIFENNGYTSLVNVFMTGECVKHEIDLVVEKDGKREIIEAKFHNQSIGKTDIQVLLYTYARLLDVKDKNGVSGAWVITNTKLTTDAIIYAQCKGIRTLAWNYPESENLQDFVENPKMYPITILSSLTGEEKMRLLDGNIVLCRDLINSNYKELLEIYLIDKNRLDDALDSAHVILNGG